LEPLRQQLEGVIDRGLRVPSGLAGGDIPIDRGVVEVRRLPGAEGLREMRDVGAEAHNGPGIAEFEEQGVEEGLDRGRADFRGDQRRVPPAGGTDIITQGLEDLLRHLGVTAARCAANHLTMTVTDLHPPGVTTRTLVEGAALRENDPLHYLSPLGGMSL